MIQHEKDSRPGTARRAARTRVTLLLGTCAAAIAVACSVASDGGNKIAGVDSPRTDRKAERQAASKVGGFHNRGLRFVGAELFTHLKSGKKTKAEILKFMEESCTRFLKSEGKLDECRFPTQSGNFSAQRGVPMGPGSEKRDLSPAAQSYMNRIAAAGNQVMSAAELSYALVPIVNDASNNLSGDEVAAVLNAAAVSDSSAHFWEANGDVWAENAYNSGAFQPGGGGQPPGVGTEPMQVSTNSSFKMGRSASARWFSWRRVFIGDMAGGIAGAFVGGAAGVGPGALAGSVFEAAYQVIDHYL